MDSTDNGTSYGSVAGPSSESVALPQYSGPPLSPTSERYRLKRFYLQQKYDHMLMSNNRIRNRLYHIKKEINHLKRLKRVLCQRLLIFRDPFLDSCLEIPDNDPTASSTEKPTSTSLGKPSGNSRKRKVVDVKRVNEQVNEVSSMAEIAKNSIISIIDSVITESHEERLRANQNISYKKAERQSSTAAAVNGSKQNGSVRVTSSGEQLSKRLLRASSIDHLLPVDPDSDPSNILTGFGENLEENFMEE